MDEVSTLDVLLYGEPIGTLTRVPGDRTLFASNEAYVGNRNRPTLGLGFKDSLGELVTESRSYHRKLMPFFSNLLPEEHLRRYLAERAGVHPEREFFLLWVLGRDLPGAVTVEPADGEAWPPDANGDDGGDDEAERRAHALRFSLAGVQLKFSAVNESSGGLTIPAQGVGGSWIVKLPASRFAHVPENEYSMMTLARLLGMDVPALELVHTDDIANLPEGIGQLKGKALAIERFDRLSDGSAVHMEDFAQIFGLYPKNKYDRASTMNVAEVVAAEGADGDIAEFIRRLTFNVLIGNGDMHIKNWSMVYPDKRNAALAPAYDFVSTIPYLGETEAALKFSRTKRFDGYSEDELKHMAARARMPETMVIDAARETVELFHERWKREKTNLPLTKEMIDKIEAHVKTVPIAVS